MECLLDWMLNSNENKTMADVLVNEIKKWLELLVDSIDMFADDAVQYLRELRSHVKLGYKTIGVLVSK